MSSSSSKTKCADFSLTIPLLRRLYRMYWQTGRWALMRAPQVEISSMDIADALAQMAEKHRYREARRQRCLLCLLVCMQKALTLRRRRCFSWRIRVKPRRWPSTFTPLVRHACAYKRALCTQRMTELPHRL